jgi:hypothetical protein
MLLLPVPDFDTVMDNLLKKIMLEVCFYTILLLRNFNPAIIAAKLLMFYFRAADTKSVRTRIIQGVTKQIIRPPAKLMVTTDHKRVLLFL